MASPRTAQEIFGSRTRTEACFGCLLEMRYTKYPGPPLGGRTTPSPSLLILCMAGYGLDFFRVVRCTSRMDKSEQPIQPLTVLAKVQSTVFNSILTARCGRRPRADSAGLRMAALQR